MEELVELGLNRPAASVTPEIPLRGFLDAFLRVLGDFAPESDPREVAEFRKTIEDYRKQIAESTHDQEVRQIATSAIRACEQYLRKSKHFYTVREAELTEMIGILNDAAKTVIGDSSNFNTEVRASADRVSRLVQLDDVRELKKRLAAEVATLHQTVEEKQKRDEQAFAKLNQRVETLQATLVKVEEEASLDPLTRIFNRGSFDRALAKATKSAKGTKRPMTLAMLDIDHFKAINDSHGHPIGDRVLLCAAQWLTGALRHTDVVARYGGEEFSAILVDADLASAEARFDQVLKDIASRSFEYEGADGSTELRSVRFTVSCGLTQLTSHDTDEDLIQRADQALYDAKRKGRNRVATKKRSLLSGLLG